MNALKLLAAISVVSLSACLSDGDVGGGSISKNDNAVSPLIGKRLVGENATFIFNADGTVDGQFRDEAIVGTYKASAVESCSIYTAPKQLTGREYCSTPVISGNTVVFNRRDGSNSGSYTIKD